MIESIREQAQREFREEQRRRAIDAEKERIRERAARMWWRRLFPFTVTITRSK